MERLVASPFQRIGLSATQRPLEEIGRFVSGGRAIELVDAGVSKQLDLRVSKRFNLTQGARLAIDADLYNLTNTNWIIAYGTTFGPQFERPSQLLSPRMFKIGGQFDF